MTQEVVHTVRDEFVLPKVLAGVVVGVGIGVYLTWYYWDWMYRHVMSKWR